MARVKDAVGLDIGTSGVRAAHLGFAKHPPTLENFGQVAVPGGALREGEITDMETVAQALSELWKRAHFTSKNVRLGLANQKVVARPIDMPFMDEQELRGAIQYQVQEHIPMPVEDAVLDFKILEDFTNERGEHLIRVLVVAAGKEMINSFVETVTKAGLSPSAIDFTPLSLIRALGEGRDALGRPGGGGEALIDVGAGVTSLVVHEGGIPRLARVLSIGGNSLTDALAAGLGVSFDDADNIKQRLGLSSGETYMPAAQPGTYSDPGQAAVPGQLAAPAYQVSIEPGAAPAQTLTQQSGGYGAAGSGDMAGRILEQRVGAFVDQIRQSMDYYMAQPGAARIARVVLCGGASKLPNLGPRLANALRMPVEQGRPLSHLRMGRKLKLSESQLVDAEPLMAAAVGTALGAIS